MATPQRRYPLKQPDNYEPKIPRYWIQLESRFDTLYTAYVGLQMHGDLNDVLEQKALTSINEWLNDPECTPIISEHFVVCGGDKVSSKVWVAYWTEENRYQEALIRLNLSQKFKSLGASRNKIGLWCETFQTQTGRFETIYSGTDYQPGWAKYPDTKQVSHKFTAYWGAMRDRIPDSSHDLFQQPAAGIVQPPIKAPDGLNQRLTGQNYDNMAHIRSGQYWERTDTTEMEAYEKKLEPTLMKGLSYLWDNAVKTGCVGLRFLRNVPGANTTSDHRRKETCAAGFFRNLADLEDWSEHHPTHKTIHGGLMRHAVRFGPDRNLRTWHEVSVLKEGEARFEYINCTPETGAIRYIELDQTPLNLQS